MVILNELREKSTDELATELKEIQEKLFTEKMAFKSRQSENSAAAKNLRREVAQIKTVIREKELEEAN